MCSHAWAPRNHILTCNAIRGQSRRAQCLGRNDGHHATVCVICPAALGSSRPSQKRRGLRQHTWPHSHGASGSCLARPLTMSPPDGRGGAWSSDCPAGSNTLNAFLVSTGIVALAEIGDKTQLLAFLLAAKFRRPLPICLGILAATLANPALAGAVGTWLTSLVEPQILRWIMGLSFIAMALWMLVPDKLDEGDTRLGRHGVFATTLIVFFLAELGDKAQIATVALVAQDREQQLQIVGEHHAVRTRLQGLFIMADRLIRLAVVLLIARERIHQPRIVTGRGDALTQRGHCRLTVTLGEIGGREGVIWR